MSVKEIVDAGDAEAAKELLNTATELSGEDRQILTRLVERAKAQAEAAKPKKPEVPKSSGQAPTGPVTKKP